MSGQASEGLERLASRLAMLTSEPGEADNAGRAVGQLARQLGLSGGQLKAIFLAGACAEGEAAELRRLLDRTDDELHAARRRLRLLEDENETLRETLDRTRTSRAVLRVAGVVGVLAVAAGGAVSWFGPPVRLPGDQALGDAVPAGSALQRMAVAGQAGVTLLRAPDRASPEITHLPAGARLLVRRLLWHGLVQWAETEVDGQPAFAPALDLDLR